MFESVIIILIGILLILWLRQSRGASHCSGCNGCPYRRPNESTDAVFDHCSETNQATLDRIKRGKMCCIKRLPQGIVKDQTIRFGLTEGKEVRCQAVIPGGPVVLEVDRQEIALGRNLAKQIVITQESGANER